MYKEKMKKYINDILDDVDFGIKGIFEPPNNIPVFRYLVKQKEYDIVIIGNDARILSCVRWLKTEGLKKPLCCVSNTYENEKINIISEEQLKSRIIGKKVFAIITDTQYTEILRRKEIQQLLNECNIQYQMYPYEYEKFPKHDIKSIEYFCEHRKELENVIDMLEDKESIETYCEYIRAYENLDFYRNRQFETEKKYFDTEIFLSRNDECIVNCGSSNGDTLFYYLENGQRTFEKFYAIEPDKYRMECLRLNKKILSVEEQENIEEFCCTLGDGNVNNTLDILFANKKVTLINMDIEGAELNALKGAKNIIKKQKPVLSISVYHMASDLVDIPQYVKSLHNDYQIIFRKYASTFRNKFRTAELIMYAVPKERLVKEKDI